VKRSIPITDQDFRLLHIMRAFRGETVGQCVQRILREAYQRSQTDFHSGAQQ
jgi:hypothetical protein